MIRSFEEMADAQNALQLPSESDLRRLPPNRAMFVAAAWAKRALSLYELGGDAVRSGVTREERRHLEDAVCIAFEIAIDPERWGSERFRAHLCAQRVEPLYLGTAVTSNFQNTALFVTANGHESVDVKRWQRKQTFADQLSLEFRKAVAGTVFFAAHAAVTGPESDSYAGQPFDYAKFTVHVGFELKRATACVRELRPDVSESQLIDRPRTALRDYRRTRDLTQDYTTRGFLDGIENDADQGRDWREKLLRDQSPMAMSSWHKIPRCARLVLTLWAVRRAIQELSSQRIGSEAVDAIQKSLRWVAEVCAGAQLARPISSLPAEFIGNDLDPETHVLLCAVREVVGAATPIASVQASERAAWNSLLSCWEAACFQSRVEMTVDAFLGDLAAVFRAAHNNKWDDASHFPIEVVDRRIAL